MRQHLSPLTIRFPIDGALVEGHDVLGESACLIREDVFDLAQLLVQSSGARLCRGVTAGVVHLTVPLNEEAVAQANDLHAKILHYPTHRHIHRQTHTHTDVKMCFTENIYVIMYDTHACLSFTFNCT